MEALAVVLCLVFGLYASLVTTKTTTTVSLNSKYDRWSTYSHWKCNAPNVIDPGMTVFTVSSQSNCTQKLLLFGGRLKRSSDASNFSFTYSLDTRGWTFIETRRAPSARVHPSLLTFCRKRVLLFGGYFNRPSSKQRLAYSPDDLWSYDIENETWNPVNVGKRPRSFSSSFSDSYAVSIRRWKDSSCECNDAALVLVGKHWSLFWMLQCSFEKDGGFGYDWITLTARSGVSPSCGLLNTLASTTFDYFVYATNCKYELWRLSLLESVWTKLGSINQTSMSLALPPKLGYEALAFFHESKQEYVLFSKTREDVFLYRTNNSQMIVQGSEGTWMTGNDDYTNPHGQILVFDVFPLIYIDRTGECWPELWWFKLQGNVWKWCKMGEPLLAPTAPRYNEGYGYDLMLGNEASIQSLKLFGSRVYVFVKRLTDRWISERQSKITVFGPQLWSLELSTMTWWNSDVARSISHPLIRKRWCGSLWLDNSLIITTANRRCQPKLQMWSYDLKVRTWNELKSDLDGSRVPEGCGHSLVALNNGNGILFGGTTVCQTRDILHNIWRFEIKFSVGRVRWSSLESNRSLCNDSSLRSGSYGHTAVMAGQNMIVYGGIIGDNACRNELWSYHLTSSIWRQLEGTSTSPKLSPSRFCSCSAVATNHTLWLAILCDSNIQSRCADSGFQTWMYLLTHKTWSLLSENEAYDSRVLSNMAFLDDSYSIIAMFDPYHASLLTLKTGCPKGFASLDVKSTSCSVCEKGTFAGLGERYCSNCPQGLTTKDNRSSSILNCSQCYDDFCTNGKCFVAQNNGVPEARCLCTIGYSGPQCKNPIYILIGISILLIVAALSIAIFKGISVWKDKKRTETTLQEELRRMSSAWQIQRQEVTLGRRLGSGAFGDVYEAKYREVTVAVKLLREWEDARSSYQFQREILFMQTIRHPNIVLFVGAGPSEDTREPFLVLEYMSRGTLKDLLYNTDDVCISVDRKLNFATDTARGMHFLHGLNPPRIHRDLKSANLLVSDNWVVKVSDFGLGRTVAKDCRRNRQTQKRQPSIWVKFSAASSTALLNPDLELSVSNIGTVRWCAPELLAGQEYDASVDVFRYET